MDVRFIAYNKNPDNIIYHLHHHCLVTCVQYPMWLAAKEASLSTAEYDLRGKQYQVLQKIVNVYETTPDDFPKLMELMNDVSGGWQGMWSTRVGVKRTRPSVPPPPPPPPQAVRYLLACHMSCTRAPRRTMDSHYPMCTCGHADVVH